MTWEDDQKGIIDKADIFDNLLSHLDNVAYKIKFFMIHPDHPIGTDELDEVYLKKVNTIIIAETGVTTGFYIKDMGFTNAVAAKLQLTPLGITGQLNIIEPYGMSFYEKLVIAAQTLGIKNHLEARYVIQLTFTGHTPSGEQVRVPFKWMVPVILQKMSFLSFLSKVSKTSLELKILILLNSSITSIPSRDVFFIVPLLEINEVLIK